MIPDLSVLWVIVLVLALTFIVQRFLFGPLLGVMHAREGAIAKAQALAEAVGKDRASIANHLRLLRLPPDVQHLVSGGQLSMGQARALVALDNPVMLKKAADDVIARGLSVRETEALVRRLQAPPPARVEPAKDVHTREAEEVMRLALGTRVRIVRKGKGGRVEIDFVSEDELNRIYEYVTDKR